MHACFSGHFVGGRDCSSRVHGECQVRLLLPAAYLEEHLFVYAKRHMLELIAECRGVLATLYLVHTPTPHFSLANSGIPPGARPN